MINFSRIIFFMLVMFVGLGGLSGCQTASLRYDQQKEGQWQAQALIKDKLTGKSAVVHLDINAIQNEKLRLDVTAALGQPVASLVMEGDQLTYVLIDTKEFFTGSSSSKNLKPLLPLPFDPHLLNNILFDQPLTEKNWTCTHRSSDGFLEKCQDLKNELVIRWVHRRGSRRTIFLEHPSGMVQMKITSFQPMVEARNNLFKIVPPKTFKRIDDSKESTHTMSK